MGTLPFACGQCMPCRFNRRRLWTHRLMLESLKHSQSCFLTLTYDAEHLPSGGTLVPRDVQLFLKKLRKEIYPLKVRYYFVGEYGDQSWRPHYHAALFGIGADFTHVIKKCWGKGHIMIGDLTLHSAQYIAGYVTKKMTNKNDMRLKGRHPEFARMSLRPGIGALAIDDIAKAMTAGRLGEVVGLDSNMDVPTALKHGVKNMPLGRYLRRKLRQSLGLEPDCPQGVLDGVKKEMSDLLSDKKLASWLPPQYKKYLLKETLLDLNAGKVASLESRTKIYQPTRSL